MKRLWRSMKSTFRLVFWSIFLPEWGFSDPLNVTGSNATSPFPYRFAAAPWKSCIFDEFVELRPLRFLSISFHSFSMCFLIFKTTFFRFQNAIHDARQSELCLCLCHYFRNEQQCEPCFPVPVLPPLKKDHCAYYYVVLYTYICIRRVTVLYLY